LSTRSHDLVGETVGSYRIERELGTGGMGAVYVARHSLLDKLAAVKMLRPKWCAEKEAVDRFFTEAQATTAVRHPGIVDVYDFGFHESGSAFLVMELLDGETLGDAIRSGGPIPSGLAAAIGWQVAAALAAAHDRDIIHRDLKPDNIFIIEDTTALFGVRAKVLDFGIAKLTRPGSIEHTSPGEIIGTPLYMSPEQCRGQPLTGQSDVYSLGCLLHHAIAGEPLFYADDTVELLKCHALVEPPQLVDVAPAVDPRLSGVILDCLAKEPGDRPTCAELASRLRQVAEAVDDIGGARTVSAPAPTLEETTGNRRRVWLVAGAAGVVSVALLIAMVAGGGGDEPAAAPPPIEVSEDVPPLAAVDAAPTEVVEAEISAAVDAAPPPPVSPDARRKTTKKRPRGWGELMKRK
jgi:serine/threonine-protein kinase